MILKVEKMAGTTRLELATSAVTGQRSNQLNYVPKPMKSAKRQLTAHLWQLHLPSTSLNWILLPFGLTNLS